MWIRSVVVGFLLILYGPQTEAARCKVDGVWYDYDSPQCASNDASAPDHAATPVEAARDVSSSTHESPPNPVIPPSTGPALLTSYLRPWPEVAYLAEQICEDKERQGVGGLHCMLREENGYWAMRGNFAMPEDIAAESKAICVARTSSFASQTLCMHNESMGYRQFIAESEMPGARASAARDECRNQFKSWSQRGSCMSSAIHRFKNPNGRNSRRTARQAAFGGYARPESGYAKESEVVTFHVQPDIKRPVQAVGEPPPTPEPLTVRQRAARLAQDAADPDVLDKATRELEDNARYAVLSAAVPMLENTGSIAFGQPESVRNRYGARLTEHDDSWLGLTLDVEQGRVYLVDFVVRSYVPGSYVLSIGSDIHVFEDLGGALQNVTARLVAEETGKIGMFLRHRFGHGFFFHAVGVTSIEAAGLFTVEPTPAPDGQLPDRLGGE